MPHSEFENSNRDINDVLSNITAQIYVIKYKCDKFNYNYFNLEYKLNLQNLTALISNIFGEKSILNSFILKYKCNLKYKFPNHKYIC